MSEQSYRKLVWRQFCTNRFAVISLVIVGVLILIALAAPLIANERPFVLRDHGRWSFPLFHLSSQYEGVDFRELVGRPEIWAVFPPVPYSPSTFDLNAVLQPPSFAHWLGTDADGRDVMAMLVWGTRISLSVGVVAVGIAVIMGVILGAISGYYGGGIDILISRLTEIMICFPTFFLILAILAFVGPSIYNIMVVIGITGWTGVARLVRGECLKLRQREFVTAAKALGSSDFRILFFHLLPNSLAPVLVSATFGIAGAILAEASLSFLGFGVPPQDPSWGSLLSEAQEFMDTAWWLTLAPGFAIFLAVTTYNIVGEGLRDAIDPHLKEQHGAS